MSDFKADDKTPRSDFSNSIGKDIELFLRDRDKFQALSLVFDGRGAVVGRLVGVDRFGLWVETLASKEAALASAAPVPHTFFPWEEVLSVVRNHAAEDFSGKKEYRGLRPT